MSRNLLAQSSEVTSIAPGWLTHTWAIGEFRDSSHTYPTIWAKAELTKVRGVLRASITELRLSGNPVLKPRQVNAVGQLMPNLPAEVLSMCTFVESGHTPSPDAWAKEMLRGARRANQSQQEHEDEVLRNWESKFQPQGFTQREAAQEMGLTHATFRTYLTHARRRRGK